MSEVNSFLKIIAPGLDRFESHSEIIVGFSRREDGGMSMKRGDPAACLILRKNLFSQFDWQLDRTVWGDLVHGVKVEEVLEDDAGRGAFEKHNAIEQTDGMWTSAENLLLCTTHADCLPLYYYAPTVPAVGVAHCGWRGIVAGLPSKMIEHAVNQYQISPSEIEVGIGPGIRVDCFEIGEDILEQFPSESVVQRDGSWYADLIATVRNQLSSVGVPDKNIEDAGICSRCSPIHSSYRRDRTTVDPAVAFIGLRSH